MARSNLLQALLLGIGLLLLAQLLVQKLGLTATLAILGVAGLFCATGYLISTGHPAAGQMAANPLTRPLVRVVCRVGGLPPPAPPADAKPAAGGPALRTPADFAGLNRRLKAEVLGQDPAVDAVSDALRHGLTLRARAGDAGARRPAGVLFLVGGEGTGKRTLLEAVGRAVFPDGGVHALDLGAVADLPAAVAALLATRPTHTVVLERLDAAGAKAVEMVRRAAETGDLRDPAGGPAVPLAACVLGLTTTDAALPTRLGPGFLAAVGRPVRFAPPDPETVVRVVERQMRAECRKYGLTLDHVDEVLVARVAAGFDPAHGFRLTGTAVADRFAPEILKAIEHQHDRLAILED